MTTRFRNDNTEGYTSDQLIELNRRYEERLASLEADDQDDNSVQDHIAATVQIDFDTASGRE